MLYVKCRKSFEVRRQIFFIILPCDKIKHTAKFSFVVCSVVCRALSIEHTANNLETFLLLTYNMPYSMLKFGTLLYLFVIFN